MIVQICGLLASHRQGADTCPYMAESYTTHIVINIIKDEMVFVYDLSGNF